MGLGRLQQKKNSVSLTMEMQLQLLELELLSKGKKNADTSDKYSDTQGREVLVPIKDIYTDTKRFQNRDEEYSEESVNRLINAVKKGDFSWEILDAILLWKEPKTGKLFVLSGHSRFKAFNILAEKHTVYKGRSFDKIPAKIIQVSEKEAIQIARESNNLATKETNTARAKYYRELRESGTSGQKIKEKANELEGKNAAYILNLSFLNPNGEAMDLVKSTEQSGQGSENANIIQTIADWVGDIRRSFPDLTNSHENEITKFLLNGGYSNKPSSSSFSSKAKFKERLKKAIEKLYLFGKFASDKPLNLKNTIVKGAAEESFNEELQRLKADLDKAEKAFLNKTYEVTEGVKSNKITEQRGKTILAQYEADYLSAKKRYYDLVNKKHDILEADKKQSTLFGIKKKIKRKR